MHGAGRRGRDAWPFVSGRRGSRFLEFDDNWSNERKIAVVTDATPDGAIIVAHSAGAVAVALALARGAIRPSALVLVEPAMYDVARGNAAIESHISIMTIARDVATCGDLFGYWQLVRPVFFGAAAEREHWETERNIAEKFAAIALPWGHDITGAMLAKVPILVITGNWNDEYEAIATALVDHGATHKHLVGHGHRPQDHPDFETTVSAFVNRAIPKDF